MEDHAHGAHGGGRAVSNSNLPPYSVLMSVYVKDEPEYLNLAIESMVTQTVPFEDMVIVCDGSLTDELNEVLSGWQAQLGDHLKILRLPKNVGLGSALSEGMSLCSCDIVARMDADDISRSYRMGRLLKKMDEENLDLVGGAIEEFNSNPGDMRVIRRPPCDKVEIEKWLKSRNPFNHVTVIFNRNSVEKVGGYEPFPWMEDYWLWARMILNGCRCANVPDVVVDVRTGAGMYGRRSNVAYLRSQVKFFQQMRTMGIIGVPDQVKAILVRTIAALAPASLLKSIYNFFLREKGVE